MSRTSRLAAVDLSATISKEDYKRRKQATSEQLVGLRTELLGAKIPLVLVFEGWDAAGKGGAIRRLLEAVDPRHFSVHSIVKPTQEEHDHHYLWRFWNRLPRRGNIAIFDRSWYGRVLVERVEGFATKAEWSRAYEEINQFEQALVADHHVIVKFFLHISKDEQKKRFEARAKDPLKAWKLNEEDFRNRKKWDVYEDAIEDMFKLTDTNVAPWHIIAAEDKKLARVEVAELVLKAVRKAVAKHAKG